MYRSRNRARGGGSGILINNYYTDNSYANQYYTDNSFQNSYSENGGGTGIFSPLQYSPLAWYKANQSGSVIDAGGGNVSAWNDISGNGYHATQGTSGNRPQTGTNTVNGKNVINFPSGKLLNCPSALYNQLGTGHCTIFVVCKVNGSTPQRPLYGNNSGASLRFGIEFLNSPLQGGFIYGANGTGAYEDYNLSASANIVTASYDGTYKSVSMDGEVDVYNSTASYMSLVKLTIGTSSNFVGQIAEIIIFNYALSQIQKATVNRYLNSEWGLGLGGFQSGAGYDVFLVAGQSNTVGYATPIDISGLDAPDMRVTQLGRFTTAANRVILATDPLQHREQSGVGWAMTFAKQYVASAATNRRVLLVPCASGGTGFTGSVPTWMAGDTLQTEAIARANTAMAATLLDNPASNNVLAGIMWHQGENDQGTLSQSQYATYLDLLVSNVKSQVTGGNANTPFVCGDLAPGRTLEGVRLALADTPTRLKRSGFAPSTGLTTFDANTHFDAASQRTLGGRYYTAYQQALLNV